jgi:hypothetical protein
MPQTYMLMPIQMRSQGSLAVVEMYEHEPSDVDVVLKLA